MLLVMPPTDPRRQFGDEGEQAAQDFFRQRGDHILQANFTCRQGEIDLIVRDGKTQEIVFVEVKTLRRGTPEQAALSFHSQKFARVHAASHAFFRQNGVSPACPHRFDAVAIILSAPPNITHFANVGGTEVAEW